MALAAVTLLPLLFAVGDSDRVLGFAWDEATRWSLHPRETAGLLVPGLPHEGPRAWHATLYQGAIPLALAATALARGRGDRHVVRLAALAALFALWALGRHDPLWHALWALPPVRSFRYPAKAWIVVALALALLGGLGLDRARRAPGDAARALLVTGGAAALVGGLALSARALLPVGAALAGLVALRRRASALLTLVTIIDLIVATRLVVTFIPRATYEEPPALLAPALAASRAAEDAGKGPLRVASLRGAWSVRSNAREGAQRVYQEALFPDVPMGSGLRSTTGFTSFAMLRQRRFLQEAARRETPLARTLALLDADLLVHTDVDLPTLPTGTQPLAAHGPWRLGLFLDGPPWASLLGRAERARDLEDAIARVLDPAFSPRDACVLEGATLDGPPGAVGDVRLVEDRPDLLRFVVDARAPGALVVREAWARGWTATVDGAPTSVLPADALFRAVLVPAGRHEVTLEYVARGRAAGLVVSALASIGIVAASARRARP
jgi:hypothetical protein